ncbi:MULTISPECIES: hypothetical protein [Arthrobacter]
MHSGMIDAVPTALTATVPAGGPSGSAPTVPGPQTARNRRVAAGPVDAVPEREERSSQARARDRAALRTIKDLAAKEEQLSGGVQTRRQRRLQELATETTQRPVVPPASGSVPGAPGGRPDMGVSARPDPATAPVRVNHRPVGDEIPEDMSVEEALAERERFTAEAQEYFERMAERPGGSTGEVDPKVLAEQIAMAERIAILNQRAQRKEELAREADAAKGRPQSESSSAPTMAHNLGSVTRQETRKVPGVAHEVIAAPTTQVPVSLPRPAAPAVGEPAPETVQVQRVEAPGASQSAGTPGSKKAKKSANRRAQLLAQAEAIANAEEALDAPDGGRMVPAPVAAAVVPQPVKAAPAAKPVAQTSVSVAARPSAAVKPGEPAQVAARDAHGLDPLDVGTAGVQTAIRLRLLHWGALGLGAVALVVGVILAVTAGGR